MRNACIGLATFFGVVVIVAYPLGRAGLAPPAGVGAQPMSIKLAWVPEDNASMSKHNPSAAIAEGSGRVAPKRCFDIRLGATVDCPTSYFANLI